VQRTSKNRGYQEDVGNLSLKSSIKHSQTPTVLSSHQKLPKIEKRKIREKSPIQVDRVQEKSNKDFAKQI